MRQAPEKSRLPAICKKLIPAPPGALIMRAVLSRYRGVSVQHLQTRDRERWPGNDVRIGDASTGPAVEAADVPARQPRATGPRDGGAGDRSQVACSDLGLKRWLGGLTIRKERQGCLKGKTTGGDAEQTSNTARGTPSDLADLRHYRTSTSLDVARCRGPRVRQDPWRPARPRFFRGRRKLGIRPTRGRSKNTGDDAWLALRRHPGLARA